LNGPKTSSDLKGKVVAVPVGTVYIDHLKAIPGIKEVRTVPNETSGLHSLLGDRADAWVTEQFVAIKAVQARKQDGLSVGEMLQSQKNAMVVSKGNTILQQAINQELQKLLKDGTYARLSQKYFERDIRCQ
jgi:polar amino acid transport system substrate-binding protein